MPLFKKSHSKNVYDPDKEKPVIHASICTEEQVAGFKDKMTGTFHEVILIQSQKDLDRFKKTYGLDYIETEY